MNGFSLHIEPPSYFLKLPAIEPQGLNRQVLNSHSQDNFRLRQIVLWDNQNGIKYCPKIDLFELFEIGCGKPFNCFIDCGKCIYA